MTMLESKLARLFVFLAIIAFIMFVPVAIWLTVPSGYFLRVQGYIYNAETGNVTLTRNLIRGEVLVRSYIEVTGANGQNCFDRDERPYSAETSSGKPITKDVFEVPPQLIPCLNSTPYTIVGQFYVKAFGGIVPLKPTFYFEPPRGG